MYVTFPSHSEKPSNSYFKSPSIDFMNTGV